MRCVQGATPGRTNKKNEDNTLDLEAAALTGGGGVFRPLAGVVRSLPAPLSNEYCVKAAHYLDRGAVALDTRPQARAALVLYLLVLHLMVVF